jgi:hypothetical protein
MEILFIMWWKDSLPDGPFEPTWESLENYQVPNWYLDAMFGIFIHWGPFIGRRIGGFSIRESYFYPMLVQRWWEDRFHSSRYPLQQWRREKEGLREKPDDRIFALKVRIKWERKMICFVFWWLSYNEKFVVTFAPQRYDTFEFVYHKPYQISWFGEQVIGINSADGIYPLFEEWWRLLYRFEPKRGKLMELVLNFLKIDLTFFSSLKFLLRRFSQWLNKW